jgi:hypothetical protein
MLVEGIARDVLVDYVAWVPFAAASPPRRPAWSAAGQWWLGALVAFSVPAALAVALLAN